MLSCVKGFHTVGLDLNSVFIENAERIRQKLNVENLTFKHANMMTQDYSDASLIYVYGTALSDAAIRNLKKALTSAPPNCVIITISYALNDIETAGIHDAIFPVQQVLPMRFVWGDTDAFIQTRAP